MLNSKIVILYTEDTYHTAEKIQYRLEIEGLQVVLKNDDIFKDINYYTNPNDYVVLLIPSLKYRGYIYKENILKMINEFNYRDINFISVNLGKKKDPLLNRTVSFNLSQGENKTIDMLVAYLTNIQFLDFEKITPWTFEELIVSLLKKMSFNIEATNRRVDDYEVDIIANSTNRNQLIGTFKNKWIIECKFYKHSRIDVNTIKKFTYLISEKFPSYRGILITNGIITSAAQEALEIMKAKESVSIHIVDGSRLKELILKYPELVMKYFTTDGEV